MQANQMQLAASLHMDTTNYRYMAAGTGKAPLIADEFIQEISTSSSPQNSKKRAKDKSTLVIVTRGR